MDDDVFLDTMLDDEEIKDRSGFEDAEYEDDKENHSTSDD